MLYLIFYKKTVKKKMMSNFAYSKQVISRSRPSKKSKSTINNVSAGLWRHVEEDDEMLPDEEMDFDIWSKLKGDCFSTKGLQGK